MSMTLKAADLIESIAAAAPEDPADPVGEDELLAWLAQRGEGTA